MFLSFLEGHNIHERRYISIYGILSAYLIVGIKLIIAVVYSSTVLAGLVTGQSDSKRGARRATPEPHEIS